MGGRRCGSANQFPRSSARSSANTSRVALCVALQSASREAVQLTVECLGLLIVLIIQIFNEIISI